MLFACTVFDSCRLLKSEAPSPLMMMRKRKGFLRGKVTGSFEIFTCEQQLLSAAISLTLYPVVWDCKGSQASPPHQGCSSWVKLKLFRYKEVIIQLVNKTQQENVFFFGSTGWIFVFIIFSLVLDIL